MACAHNGSVKEALKIIDNAKFSKADLIQFQIWNIDDMMSTNNPLFQKIKKLQINFNKWKKISLYADKLKIKKAVCVYEHKSISFIETLNPSLYKINSSDLSNPLVLNEVAITNRDINLSVGASSLKEIEYAINCFVKKSKGKLTLMYGFQSFPTNNFFLNLNKIKTLSNLFNLDIGFQDHSDGNSFYPFIINSFVMGMGVRVFEQHLRSTLKMKGVDQESSMNKKEFLKFSNLMRELNSSLGNFDLNQFNIEEKKYRKFQKKSLVYFNNFKKNSFINKKDISILRINSEGISPLFLDKIIGKKIIKNVKKYQKIKFSDFR